MNELLDDIPYGVITCKEDGSMLYANQAASKLLNCKLGTNTECNVLSFVDPSFTDITTDLLTSVLHKRVGRNYIYFKTTYSDTKFYKLVAKKSEINSDELILMIYDHISTESKLNALNDMYDQMNDSLIRNAMVLKVISHICNNVLYKDRSNLLEIVIRLAEAFHLQKASICFKNGTGHIIYANKKSDNSYDSGQLEGDCVKNNCIIWNNEINYLQSQELIFKVESNITCYEHHEQNVTVNILKLKLDSQKVVGFFEFVEDSNFKLSKADFEILESLSQLLAYIVNNKDQVFQSTNYIKEKFKSLTQTI